jgi:small subunit ribosomal protein S18
VVVGGNVTIVTRKKKRRRLLMRRKRTLDPNIVIDYKKADVIKRFITERGKIIPRRVSGATAEQQRAITIAVKRARFLALIPYSVSHEVERGFSGEMTAVAQTFSVSSLKSRRPERSSEDVEGLDEIDDENEG